MIQYHPIRASERWGIMLTAMGFLSCVVSGLSIIVVIIFGIYSTMDESLLNTFIVILLLSMLVIMIGQLLIGCEDDDEHYIT